MPSKLLLAAAEAAHDVANASRFGVRLEGHVRIDGREVMARVRRERDRFVGFVIDAVEEWPAETGIKGRAQFLDDHTLALDNGERVESGRMVIATGSRTNQPVAFEALGDRMIVNDDVFDWEDLPGSVVVFGAGVIGLELGQALSRLGVRVRIFGKGGGVALLTDPDVRAAMLAAMRDGLDFDPDAEVASVTRENDSVVVRFGDSGAEKTERFDHLLAATGRRPNVDGLGLENTSLELDDRGVPKFDRFTMQCGDSHVFIAGDVNGDIPLLHEAADQGRIAGENAGRFPDVRAGLRRTPLSVVFTDPNIASVGRSFRSLQASGMDFAIGAVDFGDQGRSRVILKNRGVLRVYAEHGTGLLLGAEMVGPRMEHVAHLLAWAHQKRMTVSEMLDMPFYHPVIEEGVRTALRDANARLHLGPAMDPHSLDCGPGA
jgi:dihydrolipoamide dehydrogenase